MANTSERCWEFLRQEAKASGRDVQALAVTYTIERLMERLMRLDAYGAVTVKGGQSLGIVLGNDMRPTKDLDLNICRTLSEGIEETFEMLSERALSIVRDACSDPADDGVTFVAAGISAERRKHQGEGGFRLTVPARIHTCDTSFVIDVGLDHEMSFTPSVLRVDGILSGRKSPPPAAMIRIYPLENTIAEKIASKIEDGAASIRHKDFYDIWLLMESAVRVGDLSLLDKAPSDMSHDDANRAAAVRTGLHAGTLLQMPEIGISDACFDRLGYALARTFAHRGTQLPASLSEALSDDFGADAKQSVQWENWCRNNIARLKFAPPMIGQANVRGRALSALIDRLSPFLDEIRSRVPGFAAAP